MVIHFSESTVRPKVVFFFCPRFSSETKNVLKATGCCVCTVSVLLLLPRPGLRLRGRSC